MCYTSNLIGPKAHNIIYVNMVEQDANAGKYVKFSVQNLEKMLSSWFLPKLTSHGVTKQGLLLGNVKSNRRGMEVRQYQLAHWTGKIKIFVNNQFHLTLSAI